LERSALQPKRASLRKRIEFLNDFCIHARRTVPPPTHLAPRTPVVHSIPDRSRSKTSDSPKTTAIADLDESDIESRIDRFGCEKSSESLPEDSQIADDFVLNTVEYSHFEQRSLLLRRRYSIVSCLTNSTYVGSSRFFESHEMAQFIER